MIPGTAREPRTARESPFSAQVSIGRGLRRPHPRLVLGGAGYALLRIATGVPVSQVLEKCSRPSPYFTGKTEVSQHEVEWPWNPTVGTS